jgi:hypothetical protein
MNAHYDCKNNHGAFRIDEKLNKTNGLEINCVVIDELNLNDISYVKLMLKDTSIMHYKI